MAGKLSRKLENAENTHQSQTTDAQQRLRAGDEHTEVGREHGQQIAGELAGETDAACSDEGDFE